MGIGVKLSNFVLFFPPTIDIDVPWSIQSYISTHFVVVTYLAEPNELVI